MDYVWSPWRYRYVSGEARRDSCIFCDFPRSNEDSQTLIVYRGEKNFIILNRFPYTSGHVMVVPYEHIADLAACPAETLSEMMQLAQRTKIALDSAYHPEGYNLGMNLGRAAGAGIIGHLHLHVLPRWAGDSNFMTVVSETRIEPEELSTTYEKLHRALNAGSSATTKNK